MKRTMLVTVPVPLGDQALTVTYRVTVVVEAVGDRFNAAWGYAEAVPVRVSAERQFDINTTAPA